MLKRWIALLTVSFFFVAPLAEAATYTWNGGGSDFLWTTAANWSGSAVPGAGDIARFDGTSAKNAFVPTNTNVGGLIITSAYTGTITQSNGIIVNVGTGSFVQGGGTFNAGTGATIVNSSLTLSGGTLIAPTQYLKVLQNFTKTGGAYTSNHGTLLFTPAAAQTFTPGIATYGNLTINDGLVGYWKFDETSSGATVVDSSGFGNNGTPVGGAPFPSTSVPTVQFTDPRSLSFDAVDDYVSVGNVPSLDIPGNVTLSVWINWNGNVNGFDTIVANRLGFGSNYQLLLYGGNLSYYGAGGFYVSTYTPPIGVWTHLTAIVNGTTLSLYANGTQVYTTPCSPSGLVTGSLFAIGGDTQDIFASEYFGGNIDDVRIYNRALSTAEVTRLYAGNELATASGSLTLGSNLSLSGSLRLRRSTLDVSSSNYTINASGSWLNAGGIFTPRSGTVKLSGRSQTLSGSTTFNNLTKVVASADTLTFAATTVQTIAGSLTLQGALGNLLSLRSSQTGTSWKVNPQGTRTAQYLDVRDANNTNGTAVICGAGCVDSGNNTNWTFVTTSSSSSQADTPAQPSQSVGGHRGHGTISSILSSPSAHDRFQGSSSSSSSTSSSVSSRSDSSSSQKKVSLTEQRRLAHLAQLNQKPLTKPKQAAISSVPTVAPPPSPSPLAQFWSVAADSLRMRAGPSVTAPQLHLLSFGTRFTMLGLVSPSWAHIRLLDGTEGYVSTKWLRKPRS